MKYGVKKPGKRIIDSSTQARNDTSFISSNSASSARLRGKKEDRVNSTEIRYSRSKPILPHSSSNATSRKRVENSGYVKNFMKQEAVNPNNPFTIPRQNRGEVESDVVSINHNYRNKFNPKPTFKIR
eukprot:TRINITY_DN11734_c0_g3_i3.p1 TRINITY_DN11734_c0_g3~~TRINITY_DN11734_c0_g3_i3.p1  ORF type:complete len:127 (-),score=19.35 TRINITY_DN11734_c0_g3_i3:192-572(-)